MDQQDNMHRPVKVADGQSVPSKLRNGQRLTSLWSGHRPLSHSVEKFLEQNRRPEGQTNDPQRDKRCPDLSAEDHLENRSPALVEDNIKPENVLTLETMKPSTSAASDLCCQGSLCSLKIESDAGSESVSVLAPLSENSVNSDKLNIDKNRTETHPERHQGYVLNGASVEDGLREDYVDMDDSQPPSDDDSGISVITQSTKRRGSDSITLKMDATVDSEMVPNYQHNEQLGRSLSSQSDTKRFSKHTLATIQLDDPPSEESQGSDYDGDKRKPTSSSLKLPKETVCAKYTSCRWVLAYLCFLARFMQTALRQSLGIAIIGMTLKVAERVVTPDAGWEAWEADMAGRNNTASIQSGNSSGKREPVFLNLVRNGSTLKWTDEYGHNWTMVVTSDSEFCWSSVFEGFVLASFSAGSLITPIIVGYLTCRYGGRKLMTVCLLAGGMSTVLLPVAATSHPVLIIVFRVITGVSLSGTDSMIQAMWARWAPKFEKASLSSVAYTGTSVSGSVTYLICGYLASIGGQGRGWPYIFYILGSLGVLLAPLWWYSVHDSPELHPRMTPDELAIITNNRKAQEAHLNKAPLNPPWRRIFKSPAVWVILVGHISNKWITSFMMSYMPRFVADLFHHMPQTVRNGTAQAVQSTASSVGTMEGLFASLPFMGRILSGLAAAAISDWMLRVGVSTSKTRKTFQALGNWSCGACTLLLAFIPMHPAMSMGFLVFALTMQNLTSVAYKINLLDIAPKYAGLLNGVMSTVSTLASLPAPVITSLLIADGSREGWQAVFCMVAGLTTFGGLIFVLFAQGDIQDWAVSPSNAIPSDLEAGPTTFGRKRRHSGAGVEDVLDLYVDLDAQSTCKTKSGWPLREMRSLPVTQLEVAGSKPKQKLRRSATVEVGAFVRRVRSQAFSNLPFSDFP